MSTIDRYFKDFAGGLDDGAIHDLARAWIDELKHPRGNNDANDDDAGMAVVALNFIAPADTQWRFILKTIEFADSDEILSHIAAGPMEHLMGHHGPTYIEQVEALASKQKSFARMLTGCWRYKIDEEIWIRIQTIQNRVEDPIQSR